MTFYSDLQAIAAELITEFGKPATLIRPGTATGPAWDPTPGAEVSLAVTVVETGYDLTDRHDSYIEVGDLLGILSAEVAPSQADKLVIGGDRYDLIEVRPLRPGPVTLLYQFHARR